MVMLLLVDRKLLTTVLLKLKPEQKWAVNSYRGSLPLSLRAIIRPRS